MTGKKKSNNEAPPWAPNSSGYKTLTIEEYENRFGIPWQEPLPPDFLAESLHWGRIAEAYINKNPLWYDRAGLWWSWSHTKLIYEQIDETDLLIMIDRAVKKNSLRATIKAEILEAFRREARQNNPREPPKTWVQFKDEIIDVVTQERVTPDSSYFMTNHIPYALSEAIESPTIDELLKGWGGSRWLTLKQLIAYCCLRDYPLHRIFLLIGSGSNGKGTYLRLLNQFIGPENVASTEMDFLIKSQFHVTKLHKKLCCQMSETNFEALSNTSMLKRLSGGDLVGFEYKNKKPFDDYNYAKIVIATNSLPVTHDKTDGFYRRWMIIDFPNKFSEVEDPLPGVPEGEFNALATWCAQELGRLLRERTFEGEGSVEERRQRYEDRSNPLKAFLNEHYERDVNGVVPASGFYDTFISWCHSRGYRELSYKVVRGMMKEEGYEYERQRVGDWDNPVAVVVGLSERSVPAVLDVPLVTLHPSHRETKWGYTAQLTQLAQDCVEFIKTRPKDNAFDLEERFGREQVTKWVSEGFIMEIPYGTYRLVN